MVIATTPTTPLLGEILVKNGVARESIERALSKQVAEGGLIGEVLIALKLIDEDQLARALGEQFGIDYLPNMPRTDDIPDGAIDKLPISFARQRLVLPIGRDASGRM